MNNLSGTNAAEPSYKAVACTPAVDTPESGQATSLVSALYAFYKRHDNFIRKYLLFQVLGNLLLLVLFLTGTIKSRDDEERSMRVEIVNQVLNVHGLLLCLLEQPRNLRLLRLAVRMVRGDTDLGEAMARVKQDYPWFAYEGDSTSSSYETGTVRVVIMALLKNLNSLTQYANTIVLWFIRPPQRPGNLVLIFIILCSTFGTMAGIFEGMQKGRARREAARKEEEIAMSFV